MLFRMMLLILSFFLENCKSVFYWCEGKTHLAATRKGVQEQQKRGWKARGKEKRKRKAKKKNEKENERRRKKTKGEERKRKAKKENATENILKNPSGC